MNEKKPVLFDAGLLVGALLQGDLRHQEARSMVDAVDWKIFKPEGLTIIGPPSVLVSEI